MWAWVFAATVASAQTGPGIESNPLYSSYVVAMNNLGVVTSPVPPDGQLVPATVAFVGPTGGPYNGSQAAIDHAPAPPHFTEALIVPDEATFELMNTGGFTMGYRSFVGNNQAALDAYVATTPMSYLVADLTVTNKTPPQVGDLLLIPLLDESDPDYEMHTFRLSQGTAVVGWLVREWFNHEDGTESYCDHYYYLGTYKAIKKGISDVKATPWDPGVTTHAAFLNAINVAQLFRYQVTNGYSLL